MIVEALGFWAYCSQCNTYITDIKYNEISVIRQVEQKHGYETTTQQQHIIVCPVCGKELEAKRTKGE